MGAKDRSCSIELLLFCTFISIYLFPQKYCYATYNITPSQALYEGQTLISPSQVFELGFFSPDANSGKQYVGIWYYNQVPPGKVVWVANREHPLLVTDSHPQPACLTISSNGNLELVDGNNNSVWSTNIHVPSSNGSVAVLLDDGNLVLKGGTSEENLWQSFQHPCDSVLPSTWVALNAKTGERHILTSWKNDRDPSPGDFTMGIARSGGPPQVFIWINETTSMNPHWRSGPWDKTKFIGVVRDITHRSPISISEDTEQGTIDVNFKLYNKSILLFMSISSKGVLKLIQKEKGKDYWQTTWEEPRNQCAIYGVCGPFGICRVSKSAICECLDGFVPKSYEEWSQGNWSGGCVRKTKLLCEKNVSSLATNGGENDGFRNIERVKLPDFYEYVDPVNSEKRCLRWCLNNCSCQAYAYVNSIGCLVWSKSLVDMVYSPTGENLFLRLSHSELGGRQPDIKKLFISLGAICTGGLLAAIIFCCYRWRANRKRNIKETTSHVDLIHTNDQKDNSQFSMVPNSAEIPIFDWNSILIATNHFSLKNKLGQGGFGPVYKGKLKNGKEIAVKRLSSSSGQGVREFKNEMILISKLQHRNLVRLIGYCVEKEEKLLIYEFMPNKSLDTILFDPLRRAQLDWETRFNIIQGVAKGLLYLHRDSCLRVIHRDLKTSNILLDDKMNPKISDFGLARIFQGTLDIANTHTVVGTLGYMSPEYAIGGIFSEKSDVFSFGVLILEMVSGRKNTSFHYCDQHLSLIAYAWQLWSESKGQDLLDKALANSSCSLEVMRCIHVGLLCVQDHASNRPNMPDVVLMLNNETNRSQPKQPIFAFQSSSRFDLQQQNESKCSLNEATESLIEGR